MGVLTITELPLELLRGELGLHKPGFEVGTGYTYHHSPRIRCPSTLYMRLRISTGTTWPAGLELWLDLGTSEGRINSSNFPQINDANLTLEREYKAHFWYDPSTGLVHFEYFILITGAWVSDAHLGQSGINPNAVTAAIDLSQKTGSGWPAGIGMHMEKLKLLRGLH